MRKIKTVSIIPCKLYPSKKYSQSQGSQLKQSNGESTNKKFVFIQQGRYPHYRYYPTLLLPKGVAVWLQDRDRGDFSCLHTGESLTRPIQYSALHCTQILQLLQNLLHCPTTGTCWKTTWGI